MLKTNFFWTDYQQASERLASTYIRYKDSVVYVSEIANNRGNPRAEVRKYPDNVGESILLSDEGFFRFRRPLPVGWVNNQGTRRAAYVSRRPQRSRRHGLCTENTRVLNIANNGELVESRALSFNDVAQDPQYTAAIQGAYPSLEMVLNKIRKSTAIAVSPDLCVSRDKHGLRWLYLDTDRIGIFTGTDSLLLLSDFSYTKEQLLENPLFTVSEIKEY